MAERPRKRLRPEDTKVKQSDTTDYQDSTNAMSDGTGKTLLSSDDILETLEPEELLSILFAEAKRRDVVSQSLSKYFELSRKCKHVFTFEEFSDMLHIDSIKLSVSLVLAKQTRLDDAVGKILSSVGPMSSWTTKQNAISALRVKGKEFERDDGSGNGDNDIHDDHRSQDIIRQALCTTISCLSKQEKKLLLRQCSFEVLLDFRIDLQSDPEPEWMPEVPDWSKRERPHMGRINKAGCEQSFGPVKGRHLRRK